MGLTGIKGRGESGAKVKIVEVRNNTMNIYVDQVGRHMLYFVVNNQPSNMIVVDVSTQAFAGSTTP